VVESAARRATIMSAGSSVVGTPVVGPVEQLVVVLGDQLDRHSNALAQASRDRDAVLMMEVADEALHVPSHRQRTVLFLSAMRHFARALSRDGWRVRYVPLDHAANTHTLSGEVARAAHDLRPERISVVQPGEHRLLSSIDEWREQAGVPVTVLDDAHFLTNLDDFANWRGQRKRAVLDHFYRAQRRRFRILLTDSGGPVGGSWNYDAKNRERFRERPDAKAPIRFSPDEVTREVIRVVERRFPDAPGEVSSFGWPITRPHALQALTDFVTNRLPQFGPYQDAMWSDESFLYHSLLSPALNLKLLDPRETVDAALAALEERKAPLQSVEGFVRQVIGWREFIRGIYWTEGHDYSARNALDQHGRLPTLYWTGVTDMECLRQCVGQVLRHGYGHHIQRLMVTGNFALTAGVHPRAVSDWYLGMYVDAVDWVTLPNALGMVMHADNGVVGTKPYAASGQYIRRMSNYCSTCRYDPSKRSGDDACPFTVFYWDFLLRNQQRFARNPRMRLPLTHVSRMGRSERSRIRKHAESVRALLDIGAIE